MNGTGWGNASLAKPARTVILDDDFIHGIKVGVSTVYLAFFAVGVVGNSWVIATVVRIMKFTMDSKINRNSYSSKRSYYKMLARRSITSSGSGSESQQNHLFFFVMALSLADLLLLLTIPMSVTDIVLEEWIFGEVLCTGFWLVEGMNKIVSVSMLTLLSLDRFLALRFPQTAFRSRTPRGACLQITVATLLSLILIIPMLIFTRILLLFRSSGW